MTNDEFCKKLMDLAKEANALEGKVKPRRKEYNSVAEQIGEPPITAPWDHTPEFEWERLSDEEKILRREKVVAELKEQDSTIDAQLATIREGKKYKRSQEASHQKVGGMDYEVEFCNKYINDPNIESVTIVREGKRRPDGLDPRVKHERSKLKRDVVLVFKGGVEWKVSLKSVIDIIQWQLQRTSKVGDKWGKDSNYYKFCLCREGERLSEEKEMAEWMAQNLPPEIAAKCKEMYDSVGDRKTIYALARLHHTRFDDYRMERAKKYGVVEVLEKIKIQLNDINELRKLLSYHMTGDGEADVLGVRTKDGCNFYKFSDIIEYYLNNATIEIRDKSISIELHGCPSISYEFRSQLNKLSILFRQEMETGTAGCLMAILKKIPALALAQTPK